MSNKRIMIILWRWDDLIEEGRIMDTALLEENLKWQKDVEYLEDSYIRKTIVGKQLDTGFQPDDPKAMVIRLKLPNLNGTTLHLDFIAALIAHYQSESTKIKVFLHRGHSDHYTDREISLLKERQAEVKYFLFGEGRDFIYYGTQRVGVLGEDGDFESGLGDDGSPTLEVGNIHKNELYQPHFDKVWEYYEHEFETKIFDLQQDLMFELLPFLGQDPELTPAELQQNISPALQLRLSSFLGNESSITALEELEKEAQKSYVFDDVRKNLLVNEEIEEAYQNVTDLLRARLLESDGKPTAMPLTQSLRALNTAFATLVQVVSKNTAA